MKTCGSDILRGLIVFMTGEREFSVDGAEIHEIRDWTSATPLPLVDMTNALGLGRADPTKRNTIIEDRMVCVVELDAMFGAYESEAA
jgi:chemotaxis signal transduction protein